MRITTTKALSGAIALTLAACGGGGGGGNSQPAPPPALTLGALTPASGSITGVDAIPTVAFSGAPDMASVSAASVTLTGSAGAVETRLAQNGNGVSVTPLQPLVWGSHYQLTVTDAVRSAAGAKLTAGGGTSFDTRLPAWGTIGTVDGSGPYVNGLRTAGAANGDTIAVWYEDAAGNGNNRVMASRYTVATQRWTAPAVIQASARRGDSPDLDVNAAGAAAAVWTEEQDTDLYVVKAARFDPASGWGAPVTLSQAGQNAQFSVPRVAIAKNGSIIATWKQYYNRNVNKTTTDSAYFDAASQQWSATRSMQAQSASEFPVPAIAANGNAMLLWSDDGASPGVQQAYAARYDAAAKTWGANVALVSSGRITYGMRIAIDGNNNAIAVLKEDSSLGGHLLAARYSAAGNSWGKAEDLQSADAGQPQLGFDAAGNALLVWQQYAPPSYTIQSRRYQQSSNSWTALPAQSYYISSLQMPAQVDRAGNAVVAWVTYDGGYQLMVTRYSAAGGKWDEAKSLISRNAYIGDPVLSMDQSGQAMLVWPSHAGDYFSTRTLAYARLTGN